jgi:site-specific DNA recombinase
MKKPATKLLRCAVYTRVSTDAGLEQDFNSLDAQREASEAYIKSQAHEGWRLIRTAYDDGGFSGGSLQRPALQRLLEDVKARLVDVIVVYKVDRLTRSLADFAKLVVLFDAHGVSFVSVTQSFNTTTSMGRLTLNVLLSFAQFEREVTGERIRDKVAASKKKGIWMGGVVPLGYRVQDRKLVVDRREAPTVRMIFERYLALEGIIALLAELNAKGIVTRPRDLKTGGKIGGVPFTRGPIGTLLKNRIYIGEITHKGQSYRGEHEAIVDGALFEAVQAKLKENLNCYDRLKCPSGALLLGKLFDDAGNLMSPTHAKRGSLRYRYYVSRPLVEGQKSKGGSVSRISADQIETIVLNALEVQGTNETDKIRGRIENALERVTVGVDDVQIAFRANGTKTSPPQCVPWTKRPGRPKREVLRPVSQSTDPKPIRSARRATLLRSIAMGRQWLQEIVSGTVLDAAEIASREGRSGRSVYMTISLAFLDPALVEAAVAGKLPHGIGATRLMGLPANWAEQWKMLGLVRPN